MATGMPGTPLPLPTSTTRVPGFRLADGIISVSLMASSTCLTQNSPDPVRCQVEGGIHNFLCVNVSTVFLVPASQRDYRKSITAGECWDAASGWA